MKNEGIHKKCSQSEVRDFLAQELRESQREGGFVSVEYAEEQIKHFQNLLRYSKKFEAIKYLMAERGWEDWDISDNVSYNSEAYFSFIGTEKEFRELLKQFEEEEEQ